MSPPSLPPDAELDPDARLMLLVGEGDEAAFEALYERYGRAVARFLDGFLHDAQAAEDLTQETFLRAWTAAPRWRPTGRVSTWLFQIAKRLAWRHAQRRRRERALPAPEALAGRPAPSGRVASADEVRRLRHAVAGLSRRLRLVFVLVRLNGLSYAETARIAGLRIGTVKSRMAAAEERLRRSLDPSRRR